MKTKRRTCENKQTSKRALITGVLRVRPHVEPVKKSNLGVAPSQKISYLQTFALNRSSALPFLLPSSALVSFKQARSPTSDGGGRTHQRPDPATCTGTKIIDWSALAPFSRFQLAACTHEPQSAASTCTASVQVLYNCTKLQSCNGVI